MNEEEIANVLDSTAFISDIPFQSAEQEFYTTNEVLSEIRRNEDIATLIETRKLRVLQPSRNSISKVQDAAIKSGDYETISKADLSVIALAVTLKEDYSKESRVISDDFAVENVCSKLSIPFAHGMTRGIRREIHWVLICPGCGKEISQQRKRYPSHCPICGTKLKRKPDNITRISH